MSLYLSSLWGVVVCEILFRYDMTFDKKTNELLSHVMQNHAEKAISILELGDFNQAILEDIGCGSQKLPLYKVSVCNAIILSNDNWDRSFLPVVRENRKQCHTLLMFWEERYGYNVRKPIDFVNYQKYCAHFVDWDMKDLLEGDLDKLVGMGYDKNEVELCYAVLTYNVELLKKHLGLKTNPDVFIGGDYLPADAPQYSSECYNALHFCDTVISDAMSLYGLALFYENQYSVPVGLRDIETLLQAAAYTDLQNKLSL